MHLRTELSLLVKWWFILYCSKQSPLLSLFIYAAELLLYCSKKNAIYLLKLLFCFSEIEKKSFTFHIFCPVILCQQAIRNNLLKFPKPWPFVMSIWWFLCPTFYPSCDTLITLRFLFSNMISGMYNEGFIFCEKVKERLCSSDDYQAFLKCLHIYSNGIIKRNVLQSLVCSTLVLAFYPIFSDHAICSFW